MQPDMTQPPRTPAVLPTARLPATAGQAWPSRVATLVGRCLCVWAVVTALPLQAQVEPTPPGSTAPQATPASAPIDPLAAMLVERGLLPATAPQTVRKVSDAASELVLSAMNFLGVRYRRGGTSTEDGFDCSGFTRHVFENSVGLLLPRRADEQARLPGLATVGRDELRPGDLVFFNTMRRTFSHVGIYVGDGKFIHAPKPGASVRIEDMREAYWSKRYTGARRAPMEDGGALAGLRKTLSGYLNSEDRATP